MKNYNELAGDRRGAPNLHVQQQQVQQQQSADSLAQPDLRKEKD